MAVRAKMWCARATKENYGPVGDSVEGWSVVLVPVMEGSAENKEFFRWTPGGQVQLGVLNPAAGKQFVEGHEYYVDFTDATP
jgi:hypothetical protein